MGDNLRVPNYVLEAREELAAGREKIRERNHAGALGIQLCAYLADLMDTVVLKILAAILQQGDLPPDIESRIALIGYGGYGRRDVAPYSDVDIMLLYHPSATKPATTIARQLVQNLCDIGLDLGFSMRTPNQACQLALKDPVIFTSLVDCRLLAGDAPLCDRFHGRFKRMAYRRSHRLIRMVEQSRADEHQKYGETVYLLEPNIKRSRGGLRDIHLLRWIGFSRYGVADPDKLWRLGHLSQADLNKLRSAMQFLLRVRNELHFHAGDSQDVLYRSEQLRLAELYGYAGDEVVLPVERFMQEYFHHTSEVRYIVADFVADAKWRSIWRRMAHHLFGHQVERDFIVGPRHISTTRRGRKKVRGSLVEVLRLMDLANRLNKRIDHATWQLIRASMTAREVTEISPEAAQRFVSLLSQPARLARLLRRLHELRVLDKLVPGFEHARCLLQFNEYHKYTVDEHSFRAVQVATEFAHDPGILGNVYRRVGSKSTLHLALLIHDIGKGFAEDHSEVGRRIAADVAAHLKLSERESERLVFLVHRHLMLNHLAFRRDNSDRGLLVEAAAEIGSPTNLQMLFVLSCADLAAVGPDVLNQWKIDVLADLYERLMDTLTGSEPTADRERRAAPLRQALLETSATQSRPDWFRRQVEALPMAYLNHASTSQLLEELQRLQSLPENEVAAWGRYIPTQQIVEYSVGGNENIVSGIFHRLTGVLTSQGLEILSAEIHSLAEGMFLDKFYVTDPDFRGEPSPERFAHVSRLLRESLHKPSSERPAFRRLFQRSLAQAAPLRRLPTQIRVDNSTSERFTIIDVFAHDRTGLLYEITRTLFELRLSVGVAKIATYLDQVVDVFYVTDSSGRKVDDEQRITEICSSLHNAIESWEEISAHR